MVVPPANDPVMQYRLDQLEVEMRLKADAADMTKVVAELNGIKKILVGVLLAIVTASIGFGFAALQIAGAHG